MTAQRKEKIFYNGEKFAFEGTPLKYLAEKKDLKFVPMTSGCWRGYIGTWGIINDKLYLVDFEGTVENLKKVRLDYLFPNQEIVFANWFSGEIRILLGEIIKYGRLNCIYERELLVYFENGIVNEIQEIKNEIDAH